MRRWGTGVAASTLCLAVSCFPQDDLEDYSRAWAQNQPAGAGGGAGAAGSPGDAGGEAGGAGGRGPGIPGRDAGGVVDEGDAGVIVPDAGASDAGSSDAGLPPLDGGTLAVDAALTPQAQCANLDGSLEPGSRNCLVVSETTASWQGAADACDALGMTLVSVPTEARDDFLATLSDEPVWLGGRDPAFFTFPAFANAAANTFSWLDGTVVGNINWAPGEPDATGGQFCIEKSADAGRPWFDRACDELKLYVCETAL